MNADPHSPPQDKTQPPPVRRVFPAKCVLNLQTLKEMNPRDVVCRLNESMARFKSFLRSPQEEHDSDEFIFDLTCILAIACNAPLDENTNTILAALKGSVFLRSKIPRLLDRLQVSTVLNEQESQRRLVQSLIKLFTRYLRHLPSSYADVPYSQLKEFLDQSSIDEKDDLHRELQALKQTRDDLIIAERQKHGKRYIDKAGQKPPNDFRDIPICPTNKEITSHQRPFLRKNILKGRYEDAEHYLDVQFRLLREDFLEPLREGIHEIVRNVPRKQRNQLMKQYQGARIVEKKFTKSGIIYQVQFDVSRFDTKRWANSKRLLFGSFLCLSNNNFETMLFATVSNRDPEELAEGRIEIRFIEDQDVLGVENRACEYQIVESPAYYEAYRHVLKGMKELDETTLPFKKYLVECSEDVDPPEYLRREDSQEPVCYDLRLALGVPDETNASRVPVLQPRAWPSVEILPLNSSQFEALKTAVTTEFSVIQGPPGTGKTYVGAKIVRCLLENRAAWDPDKVSPMLMVCYTNHALDQFLEKVLEFLPKEQIIRVGGRCKSPQLEKCNLKLFTEEHRMHERRREFRDMIQSKVAELTGWKTSLSKAETELLEFDNLENLLCSEHVEQLYNAVFPPNAENECRTPCNTFKLWLCNNERLDYLNQAKTKQGGQGRNPPAPTRQEDRKETSVHRTRPNGFSTEQSSEVAAAFVSQASSHLEHCPGSQTLKQVDEIQDINRIEEPPSLKDDSNEGTIEMERDAVLIQYPRCIHGDEDLVPVMSKQSDDLSFQNQDQGDQEVAWQAVPDKKRGGNFPWQQATDDNFKHGMESVHVHNDPKEKRTAQTKSPKRIKNKTLKQVDQIQDIKRIEELQSLEDDSNEGTIEEEKDADLIQYQRYRCIHGDEDLMPVMSKQSDDLSFQNQDQGDQDEVWQAVAYKKRGGKFPWQQTADENNSKYGMESVPVHNDPKEKATTQTKSSTRKKNKTLKQVDQIQDIKRTEEPESLEDDNNEGTIEVEKDADLIQYQRCIHGDEDFLPVMSKQSDDLSFQNQDKGDKDEGWQTVPNKKRRGKFPWQQTTDESRKQQTRDERSTAQTKRENNKIKITADIQSLKQDLEKTVTMPTDEAMRVDNIWHLSPLNRRRLYLFWVDSYRERCRADIQRGEQEYDQLCQEQEAVKFEEEEEVIRRATVVGMTTSGAARYHSMLQRVAPRVVVIEEAAEVMEAHIITSLAHDTKHTILIGDHKQLRPKATVYELALKYNLSISLFERMVMNSMDCKRLSIQHRMRPEIAALTKRIYDHDIVDHQTVCEFRDISGLTHNMFFIDHCEVEGQIEGLQSYSNPHEADFLVALCNYLLLQGYRGSQITVLTMYVGQLLLLQEKMPRKAFEGVRVCAVDNFQGEESDIILLSLVRSNSHQRIGFLNESNRICVALSRARQGFYCIGNFNLLKSKCELWKEICDDLETKNAIGETLDLVCKRHNKVTSVRTSREFDIKFGGCKMPCGERLVCGHACETPCHVSDHFHEKGQCSKFCFMKCSPNDHQCKYRCHYPKSCPPCLHPVLQTVPQCGHEQPVPCSIDPEKFSCPVKCEKILTCGHNCQEACGNPCTQQCKVDCKKTLPCGHEKSLPCFKDPVLYKRCNSKCTKVLECGHPCSRTCKQRCECNTKVQVELPCGHRKLLLCPEKDSPPQCAERCRRVLNCGHDCPGMCHEDCAVQKCAIVVFKFLPCGHQQSVPCHRDPQKAFCYAPCQRQLDCGHRCLSVCGRVCHEVRCEEVCQKKCQRGHACQRRCHFGTSCNDCMIVVNMTIPTCGHSIEMPCYVDPSSIKCKKPCERVRICRHHCKNICSKKCEARACQELVKTKLPCGHEATIPCHKDPEKYKCEEIVEVCLSCGHKTSLACYVAKVKVQKILCNVKVEKELPCKHKLTLPCHKNPKECKCKKKVDVGLSCGHMMSVICYSMPIDLQNVSCKVKMKRKLSCDHEITIPCYKNPMEHVCDEEVEITLSCGHKKIIPCSKARHGQQGEICDTKVTKILPCGHEREMLCSDNPGEGEICDTKVMRRLHCGHERKMLCSDNPMEQVCEEEVEISLSCGHKKLITCSKARHAQQGEICDTKVTTILPCGHERKILCSDNPGEVFCDAPCERRLPCEHRCTKKCGEHCASFKCAVRVQKLLACGSHEISCRCSDDVLQMICPNGCKRKLSCGHKCPGKCSEDCSQFKCQKVVVKDLHCAGRHSFKMPCSNDPNTVECKERCKNKLDCGHPCPGLCSQKCGSLKCRRRVEKTFPCGHREQLQCFQSKTATCKERCRRQKSSCKHLCKGVCGEDCSKYPCDVEVAKTLPCGHKMKMRCSRPVEEVQCLATCEKNLPCGHQCSGTCDDCRQSGSHELCEHPCGRLLVCSHRCKATCNEPCPPCDRKCDRRCPHGQCKKRCAQPCDPCRRPCTWNCPHYQCKNLCGEECDHPHCDAPCPKKLPCRHPCIGLCGENCPTVCAICHPTKLSSMLADGRGNKTEPTRCLQLFDCGHIIKVEEMDSWMLRELGSDSQLRRCPKCSTTITFSYRYGSIIKRAQKNIENVKKTVYDVVFEEITSASGLLPKRCLRYDVTKLKFPPMVLRVVKSYSNTRNRIDWPQALGRFAIFIFTLKNHFLILQQAQRTDEVLKKALIGLRGSSQQQVELKELWNDTKDAIEKIKVYLEEPQLDLKTLSQVFEQTRKFFLFSQVLEAQSKAMMRQITLSSNGATRLRLVCDRFRVFLKGNDDVLDLERLRETVNMLRTETSLPLLPLEEAKDFANFPGYHRDVWKSCDQGHVYFTGWIVRGGEDIPVGSEGCSRCTAEQ